jgi:hypothetical protein
MYASFDFAGIILDSACSAYACISGEISFSPIFLDFCDGRRRGCEREKNVNNSRNYSSKNLLHSLGLVYKSMRGMMTNSIDRDQWLNVTSESRDRI